MRHPLKPYPECKPAGVSWLSDIPAHWGVARVKQHYSIRLGKMLQNRPTSSTDIQVPYLKARNVQWFSVDTTDAPTMWASREEIEQYGIRTGDLLVCEGGEGGRCGLVGEILPGYIIQNALHRVRPLRSCRNGYLQYVMAVVAKTGWFDATNSKATIAHFTAEKFGSLPIPIPSLAEQTAIVRYLDHADRQIRRYIDGKETLIGLLEEQRHAVVQHAVTRGLDPDVRLEPSGVDWLGDVPAHWEVAQVKRHYSVQLGKMLQNRSTSPTDTQVPYLKARNVQWFSVDTTDVPTMWASPDEIDQYGIRTGDLLVCEGGEGGRCGVVGEIPASCIIQNALHRVRPSSSCRNDYLQYVMSAVAKTGWFDATNSKATIAHLTAEKFGSLPMPVPPLPEQAAIVDYLDEATADIDTAIADTRGEIDLLREYRTRLIADVVTGKVDVRAAAAGLSAADPVLTDESPDPIKTEVERQDELKA